jgi:glycosyltransferase involved in cell wall biosynthesis
MHSVATRSRPNSRIEIGEAGYVELPMNGSPTDAPRSLRIGMLSPIAWRTPPRHYGPWEQIVSTLTEGLVATGHRVTLYATGDSSTAGQLESVVPAGYEEDRSYNVKVYEALHIARCFEDAAAGKLDLIHNHFDFLPLMWSRLVTVPVVTTIHGFSSESIVPAYRAYADRVAYVAISDADRHPDLPYAATIHHGVDATGFEFRAEPDPDGHVLFFGRIHPHKGAHAAIDIARAAGRPIRLAGIIQDAEYHATMVVPRLGPDAEYLGPVGGADRSALLGSASALLHPIEFDEPFGLSVVESLLCGTPVIAYRRGALPETVRDGITGYLVDDADAAAAALGRISTIDRGACRADAVDRFGAARMVDDYAALYAQLLAERG